MNNTRTPLNVFCTTTPFWLRIVAHGCIQLTHNWMSLSSSPTEGNNRSCDKAFKLNSWTISFFVCLLLSNQNNCCLMLLSNIQKHEVDWVEVIMVVWQWVARVTSNKSVAISKQGSFALWAHVDLPRSMDCFMMGRGYGFRLLSNRTRNHL